MTPGSIIVAITDDPEQKKCNVVTGERIKELTVRMDNSGILLQWLAKQNKGEWSVEKYLLM